MTSALQLSDLPMLSRHLRVVPDCDPPFDDEVSPHRRLARLASIRSGHETRPGIRTTAEPAVPALTRPLGVSRHDPDDFGPVATSSAALPPARTVAVMLARALIEALCGKRPLAQLRMHCTPTVFAELEDSQTTGTRQLPHLQSAHVSEPQDGVAEVSAAYRRGDRVRALAFQLVGLDGRWQLAALQLG